MPTPQELKEAEEVLGKLLKTSSWKVSNDTELSATWIIAQALHNAKVEQARVDKEAVESEKKEQMDDFKELWVCEETECVCDEEERTICQEARVDTSCSEELLDKVLSALTSVAPKSDEVKL